MRRLAPALALLLVITACGDDDAASTTTTEPVTTTTGATTTTSTKAATTSTRAPEDTTTTEATATTTPGVPEPAGASGLGDPYFPNLGNGGYDVSHYDIDIAIDMESTALDAVTTITATATATLATFNLDFRGLEVESVEVDGLPSDYVRDGFELRVSPDGGIVAGEEFTVSVAYSGVPQTVPLISAGVNFGWTSTPEGIYVTGEPNAASTWFPGNDHPLDKATYTFHVTVPSGITGAANGELVEVVDNGDNTSTWVWNLDSPMATYLATVVAGSYERFETLGPDGILIRDYMPTSFNGTIPSAFTVTGEAMRVLSDWFGPYPFDRYGHIVVYDLGGALETQTLSLMGNRALLDEVVVHELAHQWWGDSVSPASWQDIWLNEGFATFAEFLWTEHLSGTDAMLSQIEDLHTSLSSIGHFAIGDPQESQLFGPAVYWRGGMTLHALRRAVGDDTLKQVFREYFALYENGNAATADFIAVAEEVSGQDLSELFDLWLNSITLPALPPE